MARSGYAWCQAQADALLASALASAAAPDAENVLAARALVGMVAEEHGLFLRGCDEHEVRLKVANLAIMCKNGNMQRCDDVNM